MNIFFNCEQNEIIFYLVFLVETVKKKISFYYVFHMIFNLHHHFIFTFSKTFFLCCVFIVIFLKNKFETKYFIIYYIIMDRIDQFKKVQNEGLELFIKKNKDYGESYSNFGLIGIITRLSDKINRLINISNTKITLIKDETLKDTLLDLQNYATLALILFDDENKIDA
jgi:hypothetical protein